VLKFLEELTVLVAKGLAHGALLSAKAVVVEQQQQQQQC
jgi:hypothetical protein